jgi:hypothetical protein
LIKAEVDKGTLKAIENRLDKMSNKAPMVMKQAINETAKQARIQLAKTAQKQYSIKTGRFNKAMEIKKAAVSRPEAIIRATGEVLEIKEFKISPNKYTTGASRPNVTKGKVYRNGSLKKLQKGNLKAFVSKFKNGHVAVVQRVPGKKMKSDPKKDFIKKLLSPSIPKILGNEEKVFGIVEPDISKNLKLNLEKYTLRALGE